jgi:flagellar biosynthesis protein FlhF
MATGDPTSVPLPGSTYRLVVNSAEEAVRLIHEKLGPEARVVSVKQIGTRGLASLLRSPQLEVIAEIPSAPSDSSEPSDLSDSSDPLDGPFAAEPAPKHQPQAQPTFEIPPVATENETAWLDEEPATPPPTTLPPAAAIPLARLLSRAGLSEQVLIRLSRSPHWAQLGELPLGDALKQAVELLRAQWKERPRRRLTPRVAFFGPPGSGATTALCKAITIDVFFRQRPCAVMKLDGVQPNSIEGLAMFCEALDVPLLRSAYEFEHVPDDHRLYLDTAGFSLHDAPAWRDLGRTLGEFYVDSRVLVLNAAYDIDLLKRAYALGCEAGATHVVFTHLDEIHHWGKLWDLLLCGSLEPLFFSCGQNVSGEVSEDVFELMAERILGPSKP